MSSEVTKPPDVGAGDGFDFDDHYEGEDEGRGGGGVINGLMIKFTNEAEYVITSNDETLEKGIELLAVDRLTVVQYWEDGGPVRDKTIVIQPGQKIPDIKAMNASVPQSEWEEGPDGKPRGPWQMQRLLYLLDQRDMTKYTFVTGTVGGEIALRDLSDKTKWMRRFRGSGIHPVIELSDTHMKTRFGGRQRPHFIIKRWVDFSTGGDALPATGTPKLIDASKSPAAPAVKPAANAGMRTVEPPSLGEQMDDTIPF